MHPRNIYRDGTDFVQLSIVYPPLSKYLIEPHKTIDFGDQNAQRCLTEALLHRDFKLKIQLPLDRLCPPVPNRLNYILWLQDINLASRYIEEHGPYTIVQGIDIGTGASAIYPLLACTLKKSWKFVVSEIDPISLESAQQNISINELDDRIHIVQCNATSPVLLPLVLDEDKRFDFTMCNPPFYSSFEDVSQSAEAKQYGPNAVCTGAAIEMITVGGESAFVGKMVKESLGIQERCRWYTSMLGKLSSVAEVVDIFTTYSIDNYIITEFVQGQTRRWAVGWSFSDIRLPDSISRLQKPNPVISKYVPAHNTILQPVVSISREVLYETLSTILSSIGKIYIRFPNDFNERSTSEMKGIDLEPSNGFLVFAQEDTWSRSARRRQKRLLDDSGARSGLDSLSPPTLTTMYSEEVISSRSTMTCSIHIRDSTFRNVDVAMRDAAGKHGKPSLSVSKQDLNVEFTWRKGRDRRLFESFCSHVSRNSM
ncbi:S-adenosyl-L-methionine dependent methyltransferase [Lentinula aciculospora]|uniref:S-adenosyl-L-methionine dependent methyltransferase n=1 Tax=Lentinula aciculospora TaxID=153920 RepID=A0A9W9DKX4_9AGAR|nr:S-adenosyl-L-methionine dependent methyltransferase [Lentinula aciculospora]